MTVENPNVVDPSLDIRTAERFNPARRTLPKYPFTETDPSKWHLHNKEGRQTWHYINDPTATATLSAEDYKQRTQSTAAKYWLGTLNETAEYCCTDHGEDDKVRAESALESARTGYKFFKALQTEDGHWAGEYGGPLFLMPGLVITCYITGHQFRHEERVEMVRYLRNMANPKDGGWGLHIAGESTVFGTALNYCTMRLLGVSANDQQLTRAREFLHQHGGAVGAPHWGKFWLSVLNVHDWRGVNPIPPEMWLLPYWLPFHPARMWCHCREVYLPMSYCYGVRFQCEENDLIRQLRSEIYVQYYEKIDWDWVRNNVALVDVYAPHHKFLDFANAMFVTYENYGWPMIPAVRDRALKVVLQQIHADDFNTKFISIGPISKIINMLVIWITEGSESSSFKSHCDRLADYLWLNDDGMRMQGTNGSQLWDTALAMHAVINGDLHQFPEFEQSIRYALAFLDDCQIKQNVPDRQECFRQISKGAWPFSTRDCGWIVSDCTAEGLKAVLNLQNGVQITEKLIADYRLQDAVDVLLGMQNSDGGFASYERRRGPLWLEVTNPSEVFGEIMVDYSYVECSSAVTQALSTFRKYYPDYRGKDIERCIGRVIRFIEKQQRPDGSFYGSWGICFTYAGWFAMEAFACVNRFYSNCENVRESCDFLASVQKPDGGWGESYLSCTEQNYVQHKHSQVVNTAWACLALMAANYPNIQVIERGIRLIMERQQPNGEWLQEDIEGVFNKTCMINYPNYKFIFTIWALGKFAKIYGNPKLF